MLWAAFLLAACVRTGFGTDMGGDAHAPRGEVSPPSDTRRTGGQDRDVERDAGGASARDVAAHDARRDDGGAIGADARAGSTGTCAAPVVLGRASQRLDFDPSRASNEAYSGCCSGLASMVVRLDDWSGYTLQCTAGQGAVYVVESPPGRTCEFALSSCKALDCPPGTHLITNIFGLPTFVDILFCRDRNAGTVRLSF